MATIDLGKIKFKWQGTYAGGTAYVPDDVVYYVDGSVGSSYMCVANTTGNAPSSGGTPHASWQYLAKGQASSPTTTQGDIIVRGASADGRLAVGTAGQVLKVNSSANGLEYGGSGTYSVEKIQRYSYSTAVTYTSGRADYVDIAGGNYLTFTPTSTDDFIIFGIEVEVYCASHQHGTTVYIMRSTSTSISGSDTKIMYNGQHSHYGNWYHQLHSRTIIMPCTGLTPGTNYYFEAAGASHTTGSSQVNWNHSNTNHTSADGRHICYGVHYKKN